MYDSSAQLPIIYTFSLLLRSMTTRMKQIQWNTSSHAQNAQFQIIKSDAQIQNWNHFNYLDVNNISNVPRFQS